MNSKRKRMGMMKNVSGVDAYIEQFPANVRSQLKKLRRAIRAIAPKAEETIAYGMPTYALGKNLVHFAAMKNHIGFYPTPSAIVAFEKQLTKYVTSKGAIQFSMDTPVPLALVEKIVRYRVKELSKTKI